MTSSAPASYDTLVTLKVNFQGSTRRFKLPLRDLGVHSLEDKIRTTLCISPEANAIFERYSDSASSYVVLDSSNPSVWKQLYRAAKAKLKLKLRVTLQDSTEEDRGPKPATVEDEPEQDSLEFAQTKPEAPLISTATSEAAGPVADATESCSAPMSQVENKDHFGWDDRLEAAMSKLQLQQDAIKSEDSTPTPAQESTEADETTTTMCATPKGANFSVCCNNCDRTIPDAHYHCSTCDGGDFDLCGDCVDKGVTCYNSDHWLLKRFVRGEFIVVSTTERVSPKTKAAPQSVPEMVEALAQVVHIPSPSASPAPFLRASMRTCNSCVQELHDREFVHCTTCDDFDLCKTCFVEDRHGHHPQHGFTPAAEGTSMPSEVTRRLAPGRDLRHHAICDGCDKFVFGVRHKCLDCPDWDYCSDCVVNAAFIHPGHRFVPIYEQIADFRSFTVSRPCHYGICCDGPLCQGKRKTYICGERYKCTVCHDTDFCASCEASPSNQHNKTHPLIKFKTPVRRVEVTTKGEDENGQRMPVMGDRLCRKPVSSRATTTSAVQSPTTSLHTVVDVKPEPEKEAQGVATPAKVQPQLQVQIPTSKQQILKTRLQDLAAQRAKQEAILQHRHQEMQTIRAQATATSALLNTNKPAENLIAIFERDTIADGTIMPPNQVFEQTWVLRNGGETQWPAGCSVKFVGGDYMGHIDSSHPAGIHDLVSASESTVCYDSVAPGQEFSFTVLLRTPAREGKVISWWRLTTKDGFKFGHRLWCDVTVQAPKVVEPTELAKVEAKQESARETPEPVKVEAAVEEPKVEQLPESSIMIFPKLEKESPEASIHAERRSEDAAPSESVKDEEFDDCAEDDDWAEESDEGFMTDEEYDILDASDEEFLHEQHGKSRK